VVENKITSPFTPPDQQRNRNDYSQFDVFWLCNWFQPENNNMDVFLLMNGNIFNYSLALEQYKWNGGSAYAIPPMPPGYASLFVQSYINAYNTAFNQPINRRRALNGYFQFTSDNINNDFIPGTFGYYEGYTGSISNLQLTIDKLKDDLEVYVGIPYLFVSAGSGGGSGFMYLNWVITTYGVPYVVSVP